jgi:hypothetical protein
MRLSGFILVLLVASLPAKAQAWKEYTYPKYSFAVSFPAEPKVESTTYRTADGTSVEARIYSVAKDDGLFKMTIADLSDIRTEESAVISHAIETLSQRGEVKLDIPHRINRVYGRQLSIAGSDGSHSSIAVFYYKHRLYQIEGIALPTGDDTADAIRFQQSLSFNIARANPAQFEPLFPPSRRVFDAELNR